MEVIETIETNLKLRLESICMNKAEEISKIINEDAASNKSSKSLLLWLDNQVDISLIVNKNLQYQHGIITMILGGPTVELDTRLRMIQGCWGGEKVTIPITGKIITKLDSIIELYFAEKVCFLNKLKEGL